MPPALRETLAGERHRQLLHRSYFLHPQLIVAAAAVVNAVVVVASEMWAAGVVLAGQGVEDGILSDLEEEAVADEQRAPGTVVVPESVVAVEV